MASVLGWLRESYLSGRQVHWKKLTWSLILEQEYSIRSHIGTSI